MRESKPITLYLPDLLVKELDIYLEQNPPNFKIQKVNFYYIVHHLTIMQIQYKKENYFNLNKKYLMSITSSNIDRYIKILKNGEFIISNKSYQTGVKSLKYKINNKFANGTLKMELQSNLKISKNIIKKLKNKKAHYNRYKPHLRAMQLEFNKIELDYEKAKKWIELNADDDKKTCYLTSINHIEDKRFRYFNRNKTNNRLDTNLTNLKNDLRQFIVGDYVSIDLKNSQFVLLGILIDNIINNRDTLCCYLKKDNLIKAFGVKGIKQVLLIHQNQEKAKMVNFGKYFHSAVNGVLYDEFIESYDKEIERDEVKDIMFKVIFSRNEIYKNHKKFIPYKKHKEVFAAVYPFVYKVAYLLKEKQHNKLAIYLQRFESYLFIDCIAKELVENGIVPITIHDSVIVKAEHQAKTTEIMNAIFMRQIGIKPNFHIKKLR